MIYFIEHDESGNIVHACADPGATIVPLINRVSLKAEDGTPLPLAAPVGVDAATYSSLMTDGIDKYTFDQATSSVVKKQVENG